MENKGAQDMDTQQPFLENKDASRPGKEAYLRGIERVIEARRQVCDAQRAAWITPEALKRDPQKYRRAFCDLLGWPLNAPRESEPPRELAKERIFADEEVEIFRVRLQVMPDWELPGLLLLPRNRAGKCRAVVFQHGGGGSPELCCDLHGANNYRHGPRRFVRHGAAVFAPQVLVWTASEQDAPCFPGYGVPYNRAQIDAQLKQVGSSIAALEIYAISRALDYLETLPEIDASAGFGMAGLSYGGFYTLVTAAVDERIRAAYSICFFNSLYRYSWPDFCWKGAASRFMAAEIAALVAPRALYIEVGERDHVFAIDSALEEWKRVPAFFAAQGAQDRLRFHTVDSDHKMDEGDAGIEFVLAHLRA